MRAPNRPATADVAQLGPCTHGRLSTLHRFEPAPAPNGVSLPHRPRPSFLVGVDLIPEHSHAPAPPQEHAFPETIVTWKLSGDHHRRSDEPVDPPHQYRLPVNPRFPALGAVVAQARIARRSGNEFNHAVSFSAACFGPEAASGIPVSRRTGRRTGCPKKPALPRVTGNRPR
jgi:hypothetical protein